MTDVQVGGWKTAAGVLGALLLTVACSAPSISLLPTGVRVFRTASSISGAPTGCRLGPDAADPSQLVRGILTSQPGRPVDSVWLQSSTGELHVIWPDVWTITLATGVVIEDELGVRVAVEGDEIVLADHLVSEARGTEDDPFVASGRIGPRCYVAWP